MHSARFLQGRGCPKFLCAVIVFFSLLSSIKVAAKDVEAEARERVIGSFAGSRVAAASGRVIIVGVLRQVRKSFEFVPLPVAEVQVYRVWVDNVYSFAEGHHNVGCALELFEERIVTR